MGIKCGNACTVQTVLEKGLKGFIQPTGPHIAGRDVLNMHYLTLVFGVAFKILKEGRGIHWRNYTNSKN
jgi:hypothetical protein